MEKFKQSKEYAENGRKVWTKGDDTCVNPLMEIHAPYDRGCAPNEYLLYFVDPSERPFKSFKERAKWLRFKTYREAQQYAKQLAGRL